MQRVSKSSTSLVRRFPAYSALPRRQCLPLSTKTTVINRNHNDDRGKEKESEWNDAWETAWLPDDDGGGSPAPWESDVKLELVPPPTPPDDDDDDDPDAKAFVEDMNANWDHRRTKSKSTTTDHINPDRNPPNPNEAEEDGLGLYKLKNVKADYRLKKQRIHASLWTQQIQSLQEADLSPSDSHHDIDHLLHSCSQIFEESSDGSLNEEEATPPKTKPDGWETTSTEESSSVWDMSQREEDILLQEFDRRLAFSKFQIASFIKTHIFSRRRPIDGWKYMIEVIGPNARKGGVSRLPTLADPATQPFAHHDPPHPPTARLSPRKPRSNR